MRAQPQTTTRFVKHAPRTYPLTEHASNIYEYSIPLDKIPIPLRSTFHRTTWPQQRNLRPAKQGPMKAEIAGGGGISGGSSNFP